MASHSGTPIGDKPLIPPAPPAQSTPNPEADEEDEEMPKGVGYGGGNKKAKPPRKKK